MNTASIFFSIKLCPLVKSVRCWKPFSEIGMDFSRSLMSKFLIVPRMLHFDTASAYLSTLASSRTLSFFSAFFRRNSSLPFFRQKRCISFLLACCCGVSCLDSIFRFRQCPMFIGGKVRLRFLRIPYLIRDR